MSYIVSQCCLVQEKLCSYISMNSKLFELKEDVQVVSFVIVMSYE